MKKGEKNYKTLFIVAFSLIAINLVITGILLFKLNNKINYFNIEIDTIERYLEDHEAHTVVYDNWNEANEAIYYNYLNERLRLEKPNNLVFESASDSFCSDLRVCHKYVSHIDLVFNASNENAYSEFLNYLNREIGKIVGSTIHFYRDNNFDVVQYAIGESSSQYEIKLNQEDNKVFMTLTCFPSSNN